jgi:hypothetical protein
MSNVVQLFERTIVEDDLLPRVNSFRARIIADGLSDKESADAALVDMQGFAAEVVDRVSQIARDFDAAERLIESVQSTDIKLLLKGQLKLKREAIILAMVELAQDVRQLNQRKF